MTTDAAAKAAQMVWVVIKTLVCLLQLHLFQFCLLQLHLLQSILIFSVLFVVFVVKLGVKVFMSIFEAFEVILQGTDHHVPSLKLPNFLPKCLGYTLRLEGLLYPQIETQKQTKTTEDISQQAFFR